MVTRRPRSFSSRPRLEAVSPLPRLDATPPVTNRCLVAIPRDARAGAVKMVSRGRCDAAYAARSTDPQDNRSTVVTAGSDTGLARPAPARAGGSAGGRRAARRPAPGRLFAGREAL